MEAGSRLQALGLIAVRGLDWSSLAALLVTCPALARLQLNNCEWEGRESNERAAPAPAPALAELVVNSSLPGEVTAWLLAAGPGLRVVHLGSHTHLSDGILQQCLARGALHQLQELQVRAGSSWL